MESKVLNSIKDSLLKENIKVLEVKIDYEEGIKTLIIVIDKTDLDNIVKATKIINPIIDELNLDLSEYVLDVRSKGVK